jgi:mRNA interferase MazF
MTIMAIMAKKRIPRRSDVWLVDFDPSVGEEIRKVRPAIVIGQDILRHLALRVVVPLTGWKPHYAGRFWHVHIPASPANGLAKDSGADAFQVKSVSEARFTRWLGVASANEIDAIADAVASVVNAP